MRSHPALSLLAASALVAAPDPPVRVALDTQALEWTISLEGGGAVEDLQGRPLLRLKDGEKLRIWWDSKGEADPTDEYRVQVGPPLPLKEADALVQKLKALGEQPEQAGGARRRHLAGGDRAISPERAEAEPLLEQAGRLGLPGALGRHREAQGQAHERPRPVRGHRALRAAPPAQRRRAPGARARN